MTTTAEAIRRHTGPALFSFGFRPFFLFSAVWAAVAVPVWIAALLLGDGLVGGADGRQWHAHEMLFGFLPGVIAGFLLTAVPNWTGRMPVTGGRLQLLFGLWAVGRIAGLAAGLLGPFAAVVDLAFLLVFAGVIWREVLAGKNMKNLPVCVMITLLAAANVGFHFGDAAYQVSVRLALAVAAGLIALIGGRIIPSFTHNWMAQRRLAVTPAPFGPLDKAATAVTALALVAWVVFPTQPATGWALIAAGLVTVARLLRWRGWKTGAEALVWILHAGYAWLALALIMIGAGVLGLVPWTAGVHALTAGAIGVMTLAVMTRASLGHTGRARTADRRTLAIYLFANAAAAARVAAPFTAEAQAPLLILSAALWCAAFAGFALAYGPMLWSPRAKSA